MKKRTTKAVKVKARLTFVGLVAIVRSLAAELAGFREVEAPATRAAYSNSLGALKEIRAIAGPCGAIEKVRDWATNQVAIMRDLVTGLQRGLDTKASRSELGGAIVRLERLEEQRRGVSSPLLEKTASILALVEALRVSPGIATLQPFTDLWQARIERLERAAFGRASRPKLVHIGYRHGSKVFVDPDEVTAVCGAIDQQGVKGVRVVLRGRTGDAKQRAVFVEELPSGHSAVANATSIAARLGRL